MRVYSCIDIQDADAVEWYISLYTIIPDSAAWIYRYRMIYQSRISIYHDISIHDIC